MRYALALLAALTALLAHPDKARAIDSAQELWNACQELERDREGSGNDVLIPNSKEALLCWGYMQAMQDSIGSRRSARSPGHRCVPAGGDDLASADPCIPGLRALACQ